MDKQQEKELHRDYALIKRWLVDGAEPHEMREKLGCDVNEFAKLLEGFYKYDAEETRLRTTERVYTDYIIEQGRNVRDLTDLISELGGEEKSGSARVSAIKVRADIFDRIIAKGQEFGFVKRKPQEKIVAGVLVDRMSNNELQAACTDELQHLGNLMTRFGGGKTILDAVPGEIHRQAGKEKALPAGGSQQRASNKVHGGRRVVKKASN